MDADVLFDDLLAGRLPVHPNQVGSLVPITSA
jgi:hypothetical protein